MKKKNKLVYGWGVNDVDYPVSTYKTLQGRKILNTRCQYYQDWVNMLQRCYNPAFQKIHGAYKDCTVCEEWKYLSNFIKWVDSQPNKNWKNCHLDKDIVGGTGVYSPDNCVYVESHINLFFVGSMYSKGGMLIGVSHYNPLGVSSGYCSSCRCPFSGKRVYLGNFTTELEAHKAWQAKKHEYACQLADSQEDPRVAKALRERYAPDKDLTNI